MISFKGFGLIKYIYYFWPLSVSPEIKLHASSADNLWSMQWLINLNTLLQICNCIYMNHVCVLLVSHLRAIVVFVSRIVETDTFYQRWLSALYMLLSHRTSLVRDTVVAHLVVKLWSTVTVLCEAEHSIVCFYVAISVSLAVNWTTWSGVYNLVSSKSEWMFFISFALLKVILLVFLQFSALIRDRLFIIILVAPFLPFIFYKLFHMCMNPLFEVVNKYTQAGI